MALGLNFFDSDQQPGDQCDIRFIFISTTVTNLSNPTLNPEQVKLRRASGRYFPRSEVGMLERCLKDYVSAMENQGDGLESLII